MFAVQSLISEFRVTELQQLLTFAQRSKNGRKRELLARSLSLVADGCPSSIAFKVHQLASKVHQLARLAFSASVFVFEFDL